MTLQLQKVVHGLPLHVHTKDEIIRCLTKGHIRYPCEKTVLLEPINNFLKYKNTKFLIPLLFHLYFRILNKTPQHIKLLHQHKDELTKFWPYEKHRSLIHTVNYKKDTLHFLWENNNAQVLNIMKYSRHNWMWDGKLGPKQLNAEFAGKYVKIVDKEHYNLSSAERDSILNTVFSQYLFLKSLPKVFKKLPLPIVSISMNPLGEDIPVSRVENLFRRKVSNVLHIIHREYPVLCEETSLLLQQLIDECEDRSMRRLYIKTFKSAYKIDPVTKTFTLSELARIL